jgi:hypothetical protein
VVMDSPELAVAVAAAHMVEALVVAVAAEL